MSCPHDIVERDVAVSSDGYCPLCQAAEIERLQAALKLLIEEICDLEGREGLSDSDWIEQVIALAQDQRKALVEDGK